MPLVFSKPSITPATQALMIFAVSAAAIHFGGNQLKRQVLASPTLQVLQRDPPAQAIAIKSGAINVIEEERIKQSVAPTDEKLPLDLPNQLFAVGGKSSVTDPENQVTDYFSKLSDHVRLDAITHNGVVINGKFVGIGESLYERAYPAPGSDPTDVDNFIAARVIATKGNTVTIQEPLPPHRTLRLTLN